MFGLIRILFRQEARYQFRSASYFIYPFIASFLTVMIYWFTSKALTGMADVNQSWYANSYFEFLLLGELVLIVPLCLGDSLVRGLRFASNEGLLEEFFLLPKGPLKPLIALSLTMLLPELISLLLLALNAVVFFHYSLPLDRLLKILLLIIVISPAIFGLGLIGAAIFLRLGRGEGVIAQMNYVASIFAGAYFPLTVLPENVATFLINASPHAALLEASRKISAGVEQDYAMLVVSFLIASVLFMFVGRQSFNWSCRYIRKNRWPTFSHP